jgi:hypothetical protein
VVKLRGPNHISEMISYKCPFLERRILLHPSKLNAYIQKRSEGYSLNELVIIYYDQTDNAIKIALELVMLNLHNSVVQ